MKPRGMFGKGDGGGGPTWQQIERLRRLRGLSDTTGLLPRVHSGSTPDDFFDKLEQKAHTLPTWNGELYFELHRGVYTTQAQTKRNNRTSEILLRDIELLATIASIDNKAYKYPKKDIDDMWESVLLCQFHDCLPVLSGKANQFVIFDDKPIYWQAWDVEVFHLETREELDNSTTSILEDTPLRVSVVTETKISDVSSIKTTISLSAAFDDEESQSYLECTAVVDWHETMKFLKVEFPVDVRHHEASYDTQFGIIRRPTHYNTSWDMAKFEVCCHKYADLSEYGYGVSILNDSKYGFSTLGNTMRLSLLRSPKAPDDKADMGKHTIRWAILPHQGPLGPETVRASFNFNNPLKVVSVSPSSPLSTCPITLIGDQNLVMDTIKRGEDDEDISQGGFPTRSDRSIIVRVYESLGGRGKGTVKTHWQLKSVHKTNLLEDDEDEVPLGGNNFEVDLGPFQLQTYRLVVKP
ncbi:hypothetical protein EsH8_IX_000790 [Colletotrichum jinshuiense]